MNPYGDREHAEARRLLAIHDGQLAPAIAHVEAHLGVVQARSQFLLTIGTLALTITGFSGPTIAASSVFSAVGLSCGLLLVLSALILLLLGSLRIRWITQLIDDDPEASVARALAWRDRKARSFAVQLVLLVCGLTSYVLALVWYFFPW
ncbi:MAG: hypothetical protein EA401_07300 [Planctomycetota bacterium]|nr:MAG: hypothetical protein EA401_07300 [Planctomycetota bacterium]